MAKYSAGLEQVLGVSAALLLVLVVGVMTLPPLPQVLLPIVVLGGGIVAARPREGLVLLLLGRIVIDTLWWVPLEVGGLNLLELYGGAATAAFAALLLLHPSMTATTPLVMPILGFAALLLLGSLQGASLRGGLELVARFSGPAMILLLVGGLFEESHRRRFLRLLPAVALLPIGLGFWFLSQGQMAEQVIDGYPRLRGAYSNVHDHAHSMALFATVGMFWAEVTRGTERRLFLLFTGACLVLLGLSFVRTPQVGLVAFTFVFLALRGRGGLLVALGGVIAAALLFSGLVQDRFQDLGAFLTTDPGVHTASLGSGRVGIWSAMLTEYRRQLPLQLLFGLGLEGERALTSRGYDAHNDYLSLLLQLGPLAVALYLGLQMWLVQVGLRQARLASRRWDQVYGHFIVAFSGMVFVTNMLSNSYVRRVTISWTFLAFAGILLGNLRDRRGSADAAGPARSGSGEAKPGGRA